MTPTSFKRSVTAALLAFAALSTAHAHGGQAGEVEITHPYAMPTPPGAVNGAAYVISLENKGKQADKLLHVSTPIAQRAEIHTMSMDNGVMRMRETDGIDLPPGAVVKMRPGNGYHFMLMGLKQPLKQGDSFPLTMVFQHGGTTEVKVTVQVPNKTHAADMAGMEEHKH